jgi:hypothetical protein
MTDAAPSSRFKGKLYLVLLEGRDRQSIRSGRSLWALQRPLVYDTGDRRHERITVPAGFVTDLASIPRPVWSFYPPDGPWVKGAIVHDFLYYTQGDGEWNGQHGVPEGRRYSRAEADGVLWEAMTDRGVGLWGKIVIWSAVRLGGWIGWARKYRKPRPHPTPAALTPGPATTTPRIRRRKAET